MKKILITICFGFIALTSIGQILLDQTMTGAIYSTELEDVGYKYFVVDYVNNDCNLYNTNYSPYATINIPEVTSYWLYEVAYVSTKVFDNDEGIEVLAVYQTYVSTSATEGYYIYQTRVIDENGSIILDVPQGGYSNIINQGDGQNRLLIYVYDLSVSPYLVSTNVYLIPGFPMDIPEDVLVPESFNAYPNPTNNIINIPYELNKSSIDAWIIITNANGLEMAKYKLDNNLNKLSLDISSYTNGVYFFKLQSDRKSLQTGKFIVQ